MPLLRNMGPTDRLARIAGATALATLAVTGRRSGALRGTVALGLGAWTAAMLFSGTTGHCPLYRPFGFSTCPVPQRAVLPR